MSDYLTTDVELTSIADAIREKGGTSAALVYPQGFIDAIEAIPQGVDLPVFTVTVDVYDTVQSITCDKTYAQCYQLLENEATMGAVLRIHPNYPSSDYNYGVHHGGVDYDSGYYALYGPVFISGALYDIKYRSNGSIELVSPSEWSGEEGIPVATKGTVNNHSITVTPSVVNTGGFIDGNATITGTPVTVSASELVSGTKSITSNGMGINVTDYAAVDVNVPQASLASVDIREYLLDGRRYSSDNGRIIANVVRNVVSSKTGDTISLNGIPKLGALVQNSTYHIKGVFTRCTVDKSYSVDTDFVYTSSVRVPWYEDGTQDTISMSISSVSSGFLITFYLTTETNEDIWADFVITSYEQFDGYNEVTLQRPEVWFSTINRTLSGTISYSSFISGSTVNATNNAIGSYAFAYERIRRAYFSNVGAIGAYAFASGSLAYAEFPNAYRIESGAFNNCRSLISVSFPSVTTIYQSCFFSCLSLQFISLPNISAIPNDCFYNCQRLSSVYFPNVTSIGSRAFTDCLALTSFDLSGVTSIGFSAFASCFSLSKVINTESLPGINSTAFFWCTHLESFSADNASFIGNTAFGQCTSLSYVYFPNATTISVYAFTMCKNLTDVSFPNVTEIQAQAFNGCSALSFASFPKVTKINTNAFSGCISLASIYLPSLISTASSIFSGCLSLTNISVPALTTVGGYGFAGIPNLSSLVFQNVSTISGYAFASCYNLLSLYLLGDSVCTLVGATAFMSTPISNYTTSTGGVHGSIFVPASLYSSYRNATNWKTYSARIVSLTDAEIASILS